MTKAARFLAIDLGAESGRVFAGSLVHDQPVMEEIHRLTNGPVRLLGSLHWDVLRLWTEVKHGLALAATAFLHIPDLFGSWQTGCMALSSPSRQPASVAIPGVPAGIVTYCGSSESPIGRLPGSSSPAQCWAGLGHRSPQKRAHRRFLWWLPRATTRLLL